MKDLPLPPNPEAKAALDKAAEKAQEAKNDLDNKKPADARPDQKEAIKKLEDGEGRARPAGQGDPNAPRRNRQARGRQEGPRQVGPGEKKVADDAKKTADEANPRRATKPTRKRATKPIP